MNFSHIIDIVKEFAKDYYPLVALIATVLALLFGSRTGWWQRTWSKIRDFWRTDIRELKKEKAELEQRLIRVRDAFDDDNNLWLRQPITPSTRYHSAIQDSIPIVLFANLKGGVGKTTIAANLTTFFEIKKHERVLAIDLDHQGSLSSMLLPENESRVQRSAEAVKTIIRGSANGQFSLFAGTLPIRNSIRDSRLIDCDDPFSNFETRLVLEWLIGDKKDDIRYNLARVLQSAEVQQNFDRVIIDAPPRITAGLINALCASTHLVVPFVLDILSAERVGLFLRTVKRMRGQLFPHLELAGVVGTMKGDGTQRLRDAEQEAIAEAERGAQHWGHGNYVLKDVLIPRRQAIADVAGLGVDSEVLKLFEPLGERIFALTQRDPPHRHTPSTVEVSVRRGARHVGQFDTRRPS